MKEEFVLQEHRALAEKYVPHLRYDKMEPYSLEAVGYTVFTLPEKSSSCNFRVAMELGETVIEYAFFYDFDIQHLYDLEHVFVKINETGQITGVVSSFHGKFLNSFLEGELAFEDTHPVLYVQPGKHAFMPLPHYFRLFLDRDGCCGRNAGSDGFLVAPMFAGRLSTDRDFDRKVERYIREHHAFIPSWEFVAEYPGLRRTEEVLMTYEELDRLIVERMTRWKEIIENV